MDNYGVVCNNEVKTYKTSLGAYKRFKKLIETDDSATLSRFKDSVMEEMLVYNKCLARHFVYNCKNEVLDSDRIVEEYYFKCIYEAFPVIYKLSVDLINTLTNKGVIVNSREIKRAIIQYFMSGNDDYSKVVVLVSDAIYINIDDKYSMNFAYKNKRQAAACSFVLNK